MTDTFVSTLELVRSMGAGPDSRRWETCVHEAGHLTCAAAYGIVVKGAWVVGDRGLVGYDLPRTAPRKLVAQIIAKRAAAHFGGDEACKLLRVARVDFARDRESFLAELPPGQGPVRAERIARERARRALEKNTPALRAIAKLLHQHGAVTGPEALTLVHPAGNPAPGGPTDAPIAA